MNKIYIVMQNLNSLGENFGPDVLGVFDSEEKASEYIKRSFRPESYTYNSDTEGYYFSDKYHNINRWVVEMELNKGFGE